MNLTQFFYNKVTITYAKEMDHLIGKNRKREELHNVRVSFKQDGTWSTILTLSKGDRFGETMILTKAKVLELTPWSALFEAHWFSAKVGEPASKAKTIKASIVCEF